ncbi:MAG: rubrerythrin family protein [Promethearchaeota archaeon]
MANLSILEKNLKEAIVGESKARKKYELYAEKALEEGFKGVSLLFHAISRAETVHTHNHLRVMGGIKSTVENLKVAIKGEHHEFTNMYPDFSKDAKEEGNKQAERSFDLANQVEKIHHGLYEKP